MEHAKKENQILHTFILTDKECNRITNLLYHVKHGYRPVMNEDADKFLELLSHRNENLALTDSA